MTLLLFASIGGVFAVWEYAEDPAQQSDKEVFIQLNEFDYTPPMPEKEVTLLERIYALLNNLYENKDLHAYVCEDRKYNAILFRAIDALHKYQRERKQKY